MLIKVLVTLASSASIGFGVWHLFVPTIWRWYSYIAAEATELVAAVRTINVFFSLCLVLIGTANIIFVFADAGRLALIVMLSFSAILWGVRVVMQLLYPQGSINPVLQYGMLAAFVLIFSCYAVSLCVIAAASA